MPEPNHHAVLSGNVPEKPIPGAVLHIPHASTFIPDSVRATMLLSDEELNKELIRMTDRFTDELFTIDPSIATSVIFPVSRLVVDPERFLKDEPMERMGMGPVYVKTSTGRPLRANFDRQALLAEFYHPHHQRLTNAVQTALNQWGKCLIVDCHSFASQPLPHEPHQTPDRPNICIGADEYHSPRQLVTSAVDLFGGVGFSTRINTPFAGALVPQAFYRRDPRVTSLMVEINRQLYLDEASGQRLPAFPLLRDRFQQILQKLIAV